MVNESSVSTYLSLANSLELADGSSELPCLARLTLALIKSWKVLQQETIFTPLTEREKEKQAEMTVRNRRAAVTLLL